MCYSINFNLISEKSDDGKLYLSLKKIVLISPCLRLIPNPEPLHFSTKEKGGNAPRYLNFIMNDGLSNKFILRTKMITFIRKFLDDRGIYYYIYILLYVTHCNYRICQL